MRVSLLRLLALALALGCRRSPAPVPRRAPPREPAPISMPPPPPAHVHRAGWVQGFRVPGVPRAERPGWDVAVTVRVRGDREVRTGWAELDVELRVLHRGAVVAENDDEGRRGRAGLVFVPAEAGAYVLRVTTHGPWLRTGGYVLAVE